ncbi:MAG: sulfatase-like hydrolase/transferase [Planctomycetaceae bacterium]|nr:sulfatase-like hydrolase/transferase [Planctomycetaceae bacterium]
MKSAVVWGVLLLLTGWSVAGAAEAGRPNVILIMVDDFGYECITANGGESYQTPNVDRLAATGVRFEHCHVQPLCTPTRVQLMTGKYNIRNYLQFGKLVRSETTFGHLFQQAGYATGICGKWQLGHETDAPQHFGFQESCLWQQTRRPPRYANPGLEYNGTEKDFNNGEYGPTLVNDFAVDFIQRHKAEPFFLYYPMILTHSPFQPTPDSPNWDPTIKSEREQQNNRHFADMTAYTDKMVGRLVSTLTDAGIRDNTLIIFIGDNGTLGSITSRFQGQDFKGGKGKTNHRGTHVPCIVNWPAVIKQASVRKDLVSSTDFLPTICEAAGIEVPEDVDGVSFLPQLKGRQGTPREWLYTWYSPRQRQDLTVKECVFDQHYKLYRTGEFYDLSVDPDETQPIAAGQQNDAQQAAHNRLQTVLDEFKDARPKALDDQFRGSAGSSDPEKAKKTRKRKQAAARK